MLDKQDLRELQTIMETVVNTRAEKTENLLLEELSRTQNILDKRIETVQNNLDELKQYYRIHKLEYENNALLLQMINDLKKEVDELKKQIAQTKTVVFQFRGKTFKTITRILEESDYKIY